MFKRELGDLPEPLHGPTPFFNRCGHGLHLAYGSRDHAKEVCSQTMDHSHAILHVIDRSQANILVVVQEITAWKHHCYAAPAFEVVFLEQAPHGVNVVTCWLSADLDAVITKTAEPLERSFNRLGPHPVVHCEFHKTSLFRTIVSFGRLPLTILTT